MTYQERVRELAEKMAEQLKPFRPAQDKLEKLAEIVLAECADWYENAHHRGYHDHIDVMAGDEVENIRTILYKVGLKPQP
jgi:hypothetical protein